MSEIEIVNEHMNDDAEEESETLEIPDWIQSKISKAINERKNNIRNIIQKENAIQKLNEHIANGTAPKSVVPNIKIHVSEKYQEDADKILEDLNKQYAKKLTEELVKIREKEFQDEQNKKKETFSKLRTDVTTTLEQLRNNRRYEGNIATYDRDRKGFINIFRLEAMSAEKEIRRDAFFKDKKKAEEQDRRNTAHAERQADSVMQDPIQNELKIIKDQLTKMEERIKNRNTPPRQPRNDDQRKPRKNTPPSHQKNYQKFNHKNQHPKGQGRQGYHQPHQYVRNQFNQNRRNFNHWRNQQNFNTWRNTQQINPWYRNIYHPRNGQGNGNQNFHHPYTNQMHQSGLIRPPFRKRHY